MDNIFGVPMGSLAAALAALLGLLLVPVFATAVFQRVMFRIGIRNIPRRRAQTVLIVLGLMLATLIMSSALGFGDSLNYSIKKGVYDRLGPIDETVAIESVVGAGARAPFPEGTYREVAARLAGDAAIDGHLPSLSGQAAVHFGGRSEPGAQLMGVPADQTMQELRAPNGATLAGLQPGEVLINARLAADLGVAAGDRIGVVGRNGDGKSTLLRLIAGLEAPDGGEVRVEVALAEGSVLVSVSDQGLGIPPDQLEQVFERFHRVDSERTRTIRGTGLGLAICQAIVAAHGGRIWAESPGEGRGSTFRFTLRPWEDA